VGVGVSVSVGLGYFILFYQLRVKWKLPEFFTGNQCGNQQELLQALWKATHPPTALPTKSLDVLESSPGVMGNSLDVSRSSPGLLRMRVINMLFQQIWAMGST
jgi:hypothetical protein